MSNPRLSDRLFFQAELIFSKINYSEATDTKHPFYIDTKGYEMDFMRYSLVNLLSYLKNSNHLEVMLI